MLGPILFLVYINNISRLNLSSKLFLFADDTLLFLRGRINFSDKVLNEIW